MSVLLKVLSVILGFMLISAGITFATNTSLVPEWGALATSNILVIVIGAAVLVYGIFNTILWFRLRKLRSLDGWDLAGSIIAIILGVLLLVNSLTGADIISKILRWVVSIGMLLIAIRTIRRSILLSKADTLASTIGGRVPWVLLLVLGILMLLVSIAMLLNKQIAFLTIGLWLAIGVISMGVSMIAFAFAA